MPLGDRLGRRRLSAVDTAVFTLRSLACALASSASFLSAFQAVQAIGDAGLFAVGLSLIAIAIFGADSGTAVALGPLVDSCCSIGASQQPHT